MENTIDRDVLRQLKKPARYIGGEVNQVKKDLSTVRTKVGLCYPDVYEIGMSHIGLKILYRILNDREDVAAERVYAPWPDMEAALRKRSEPLRTLENGLSLSALDVLGFTLQYELSYTNILNVLDLGGIPIRACDRGPNDPVIIGGGPTAFNPEPLAAVLDAFCLGDAEELIHEVVDAAAESKAKGESRTALWIRLSQIQGVYVPGLYDVHYEADGTIAAIVPKHGAPQVVRKRVLPDLNSAPYFTADVVPNIDIVHDRYGVEVQRGCMRGCRFCQAGYIYRPERQRSPETVRKLVREGLAKTGATDYSLLSLSLGDYNCIEPLLLSLMDEHADDKAAISTPSMRLESLTPAIMDQIGRVRKSGFTVAPEAGSNRLRAVINKVIDEDVLIRMVGELFSRGWRTLKMYYMLGLPTEQEADLQAIVDLGRRCRKEALKYTSHPTLTVSVSSFVPKPHTPFQWSPQVTLEEIKEKQAFLSRALRKAKLNFRCHEATSSIMEGVFSRGDRRTGEALIRAHELGARMDGWQEFHNLELWEQALAECGLDRNFYNRRRRDVAEILPWDHIDCGVVKEWLWEDWMRALEEGGVADCSETPCYDCGVCDHQTIHNRVYPGDGPDISTKHRAKKAYIKRSRDELVAMPTLKRGVKPPATVAPTAEELARRCDTSLPADTRRRLRIRFAKRGNQSMTSHLEVMSALHRALKRSGAPVIFTNGMHPRIKSGMSPPIPLGAESEAEFIDVEVKKPYTGDQLRTHLSTMLPEGLTLLEVCEIELRAKAIAASLESVTWAIRPPDGTEVADLIERWQNVTERSITVENKGKKRTVDMDDQIVELQPNGSDLHIKLRAKGGARLRAVLSAIVGQDPIDAPGWRATKIGAAFEAPA